MLKSDALLPAHPFTAERVRRSSGDLLLRAYDIFFFDHAGRADVLGRL